MKSLAQIDFDSLVNTKDSQGNAIVYSGGTVGILLGRVLLYALTFAGVALLLYLIMGGFKIMTSSGDPKKMQEGQGIVTNALIGFVVIFLAFTLTQVFGQILGLQPISTLFTPSFK